MPSNLLTADTSFPQLTDKQSNSEKFSVLTNYLYMLLEQLRYTLANLGQSNFNETEFEKIANIITEPVYIQLHGAEGDIAALQITAQSLTSRITNTEGNVSVLQQTAETLTSRISDTEGNISSLEQTVYGMTLKVENGESSSSISLTADGASISSQTIRFTGMVTFADLEGSGSTTINGDNITTGTISAIDIEGCIFRSLLSRSGSVGGEIEMCYGSMSNVAGGIRLDDQGAGTEEESEYRMYIYTDTVNRTSFALKLDSAAGISLESVDIIALASGGDINLETGGQNCYVNIIGDAYVSRDLFVDRDAVVAGDLRVDGDLYVNGVKYEPASGATAE